MQEPENYIYAAFVSYRHHEEDRRWAEWLVDALESYRTPEKLVGEGFPTAIGRIFRDDDELNAVPDLSHEIRAALWTSKYLLVVCSPETPRSDWVRAEIALFQAWGRGERIVPILVEGNPATSFPPELKRTEVIGSGPDAQFRTVEPRGPDVSPKQGKSEGELREHALLTIAASVLGCAFDALRDRHEERERRLTSSEWFDQLLWRRQAPVGAVPLTPDMVARRANSFRFDSIGGRVVRVRRENSAGVLVEEAGVAQWDVGWRDDGTVELVEERSRHGVVRLRRRCNRDASKVDLTHEDDSAAPMGGIATGFGLGAELRQRYSAIKSTIVRLLMDYDDEGWPVRIRYCRDAFDTPEADALGHFGSWSEVNALGQPVRQGVLDQAGQPMVQRNGVSSTRSGYSPQGRLQGWAYFDEGDEPIIVGDGYASVRNALDEHGNWIDLTCLGPDGSLVLNRDGYARASYAYDARGNLIELAYFGLDGSPVLNRDGYARLSATYDARGNLVEEAYFGPDGSPVLHRNGYARLSQAYDARGNLIEQAYFGPDGSPVLDRNGFARLGQAYDARGNRIELAYFGLDGSPVLHRNGFARLSQTYDVRGNLIEQAFFGPDGSPVLNRDGVARQTFARDARGNAIELMNFDVDGAPASNRAGYSGVKAIYDLRGNVLEEFFFDADGAPTMCRDGYARLVSRYDKHGNRIEQETFDATGMPCEDKNGVSIVRFLYDSRGNHIETCYFDRCGKPCMHKFGYWKAVAHYDLSGRKIKLSAFGVDGLPCMHSEGYSWHSSIYDRRGNLIEEAYFDISDGRVLTIGGYAKRVAEFADTGKQYFEQYCGLEGELVLRHNSSCDEDEALNALYADWRPLLLASLYNEEQRGEIAAGGFATVENDHDSRGDLVVRRFLGVHDEPVNGPEGFATIVVDYAFLEKPAVIRGFTADGSAMPELHIAYTPLRDVAAVSFRTPDGQPWLNHQGFAEMRMVRDRFQDHVETHYFDANGVLVGTRAEGG